MGVLMKRYFVMIMIYSLFFVCLASADDWPQFRRDPAHSARSLETLNPPLSVKWTFMAEDKIISSPSVANDILYFGSRDNTLYALDTLNGDLLWKFRAEDWIDSSPAIKDSLIYFTSRDGHIYCLNSEIGELRWKYKLGGADSSSPIVDQGAVYAGSGFPNKFISALNVQTGSKIWQRETGQMIYSSPAIAEDSVLIGSNDGYLYSFNKFDGVLNWKFKTRGGIYFSSPAISDNYVFLAAGDFDWTVYAINIDTGELIWEQTFEDQEQTPAYVSSVAVGDDEIFYVSGYHQQFLYCRSVTDGNLKWKARLSPSTRFGFSSSPVLTKDIVYVSTAKGMLKAFDIETGDFVWEYDLEAEVLSSVTVSDGQLYIATLAGKLFALE
jgi:eukaryotic-like serine/threonine-protein kinase